MNQPETELEITKALQLLPRYDRAQATGLLVGDCYIRIKGHDVHRMTRRYWNIEGCGPVKMQGALKFLLGY